MDKTGNTQQVGPGWKTKIQGTKGISIAPWFPRKYLNWDVAYLYIYITFLNHLRISSWHCTPSPSNTSVSISKKMRPSFYIIIVQLSKRRNWTFIQYHQLIHNPNANSVRSSNNVLYPGTHSAFSRHISLVSFELEQFLSHSLSLRVLFLSLTLTFLKSTGHLFCRSLLDLRLSDVSSWLDLSDEFLAETPQK